MRDEDQEDLAVLLAACAQGDRGAFSRLYERTSRKLLASIRRIFSQQAAAEDALQEAYVRIWRRAETFDPSIASPIAWMTTIARHAAIDQLRRGAERVAMASVEVDEMMANFLVDPGRRPDESAAARDLTACLETLEQERRQMVLLAYCQGWSREELAARFDRPVPTIKTLLRRALIALKECLS